MCIMVNLASFQISYLGGQEAKMVKINADECFLCVRIYGIYSYVINFNDHVTE